MAWGGTFVSVCIVIANPITRIKPIMIAALLGILPALVLADDQHVETDRKFDFSKLTTYQLRPGRIDSGRTELNNAIVMEKISEAIRKELSSRGLKETATQPDVLVEFAAAGLDYNIGPGGIANAIDASRGQSLGRGARGPDNTGERGPVDFSEGTLVIDISSRSPGSLIWRGVYRDHEKNSAKLGQNFPADVRKLFAQYPVKGK